MAEFKVTISEMTGAAGKLTAQAQAFADTANAVMQATTALTSSGWQDEASEIFTEKIGELQTWCTEMSGIIETYGGALNTISDSYAQGDAFAASQFK